MLMKKLKKGKEIKENEVNDSKEIKQTKRDFRPLFHILKNIFLKTKLKKGTSNEPLYC